MDTTYIYTTGYTVDSNIANAIYALQNMASRNVCIPGNAQQIFMHRKVWVTQIYAPRDTANAHQCTIDSATKKMHR